MTIEEISKILNEEVPGMGKVVLKVVARDLRVDINNLSSEDLKNIVNTSLARLKLFVGLKRAQDIAKRLEKSFPNLSSEIATI